jgi:hypothetical protein
MELLEKLVEWLELAIEMIVDLNPGLTETQWAVVVLVVGVVMTAVGGRLIKVLIVLVFVGLGVGAAGRLLEFW